MCGVEQSIFDGEIMPLPAPMFREPRFERDKTGRPTWILADDAGCEHVFTDGTIIRDARFSHWNMAGVLIRQVVLDTVVFSGCRLANFEVQDAQIRRLVISGCEGGLVVKSCSINDVKVEDITDPEAVVRFFGCEVVSLLITDCKCGIDIARSEVVGLVFQRCNFAGRVVAIRVSTLRAPRIVCCTFTSTRIYRANFFESEIVKCDFIKCHWEDVDISLSQLLEVTLSDCRIHKLSLDAVIVRTLKIFETRAFYVTSQFSDLFDVEVVHGILGVTFEHAQVRSLMLYRTKTVLAMKESYAVGLRLCDVTGIIGGIGSTWWAPVIRRSILHGNGTRGITLIGADCTNTEVINDFGIWADETHIDKGPSQ